jgi:hypothetical protein
VSFRQGLPPDNSNLPGSNISFASVQSIMNGSQLGAPATIGSPANAGGWNGVGNWFLVTGGGWPSAGGSLTQPGGGAFNGRNNDNGSVSLAFMVYDWLRSMGLRPRVTGVAGALSFNFRNFIGGSSAQAPAGQTFSMNLPDVICAPAYAQSPGSGQLPVSGGIFCVGSENAGVCSSDQRDFTLSNGNPGLAQQHQEQTSNVVGYRPTDISFGADVKRISIDETGAPKTTSGDDVGALFDLQRALGKAGEPGADLQTHCATAYNNAQTVVAEAAAEAQKADAEVQKLESELATAQSENAAAKAELQGLDPNNTSRKQQLDQKIAETQAIIDGHPSKVSEKKAERDNARKGQKRANYVKTNANHASLVGISMLENLGALTAISFEIQVPGKKFMLAKSLFVPPMKAPTVAEIKGEGAIPTGREAGGPGADDWAVQPDGADSTTGEGGKSILTFYQHLSTPIIGHNADPLNRLMQPALAQGAIPANGQLMFFFNVLGDTTNVSSPGGQVRFTAIPTSPFINMNTLPGQVHYQSVSGLRTRAPGSTADVLWTVQARDNNAFGGSNSGYFADTNGTGYNMSGTSNYCQQSSILGGNTFGGSGEVCPSLVTEWQIGCPTPVPPGGSCGVTQVRNPDGTVTANAIPCPPPPPAMG